MEMTQFNVSKKLTLSLFLIVTFLLGIDEKKVFGILGKIERNQKELNINRYKGYYSLFKLPINHDNPVGGYCVGIRMIHM
ncbi:hypothetical protein J2S19_000476 [Metabacillus malikii]|uniref:Uncharacterized protein n=1 Tax=Metabacillus malikii TaxID=1504265 RepID=A0ABT9ZAE0_9BACI|nr:hypothetical protein [Metabacillus malikii]